MNNMLSSSDVKTNPGSVLCTRSSFWRHFTLTQASTTTVPHKVSESKVTCVSKCTRRNTRDTGRCMESAGARTPPR